MAAPHTVQTVPFGIPVGGNNFRDSLAQMSPIFSPYMVNWDANDQVIELRQGYRIGVTGLAGTETILQLTDSGVFLTIDSGDSKLRVRSSSGSLVFTTTSTYSTAGSYRTRWFKHAGYEYFLHNDGTLKFDGTNWSEDSFTDGASDLLPTVATSYKGRAWLVVGGSSIWYSGLGGVTGATTEWDVEELLEGGEIAWVGSLTSPGDRADETYFAFGTFEGLVFVYSGDNPGASNWALAGQFKIPTVCGYQSILEYQNDIWIATYSGIVSVRRLFQVGFEPDDVMVTRNIEPVWKLLLQKAASRVAGSPTYNSATSVALAYNANINRVMVRVSGRFTNALSVGADGSTHFVYNSNTGSWSIHTLSEDVSREYFNTPQSLISFGDSFSFISGVSIMRQATNDTYFDEAQNGGQEVSYTAELHSAYQLFGSNLKYKQAKTVEPIIETNINGDDVDIAVAGDFGKEVSADTSHGLQTGISLPIYNVGVKGLYIQYRIKVRNSTEGATGFKIYAVSAGVK